MKKAAIVIWGLLCSGILLGQDNFIDDYISLAAHSPKKMEQLISRKGFRSTGTISLNDSLIDTWAQYNNPAVDSIHRRIWKYKQNDQGSFAFLTTSRIECDAAIARLKGMGYSGSSTEMPYLLQRKNITVTCATMQEEENVFYKLIFHQQKVPSVRSIRFADDLLQFDSHEMLAACYGEQNVTREQYFISENEHTTCSILFPGSPREAVFVWKDGANAMSIDHIAIGNKAAAAQENPGMMRPNNWLLKNGIYFNMRLDQLVRLNEDDIYFFGRNSDYYLNVKQQKKAHIDFATTGVILDCLNCDGSKLLDTELVSAADALGNSLRLHVGTIILFPEEANRERN